MAISPHSARVAVTVSLGAAPGDDSRAQFTVKYSFSSKDLLR